MKLVSSMEKHITNLLLEVSSMRELKQTHALITKTGLTQYPPLISKLISLSALASWGSLEHAQSVFDSITMELQVPFFYNTMIRAYSQSIFLIEAIHLYNQMCRNNVKSDNFTYPFVLKACGKVCAIEEAPGFMFAEKGAEIHCRSFHLGLECDGFIQNSLIFMYSQCGRIDYARQVFDAMVEKTLVSWNTMIVAYDRCNDFESADSLLGRMPEKNVVAWNSIITRYARLGDVEVARRIFEEMPERDAISWNSMIAGYVHVKDYKCALELFNQMQIKKIKSTELTIVSVLGACAETGALELGREIHKYLKQKEFKIEGFVGNALLDMYAKCGSLKLARQVFDAMGLKHVSCWNSMIVALAVHGHCEEALNLFSSMEEEAVQATKPNRITFLGVLIACSHKGLVEEGRTFFRRMVEEYKIKPDIKHYGCMVDLLSRCGQLDDAYRTIKEMPIKANAVLWKTVLGACRVHVDVELAEESFRELAELEPPSDEDYVLLSNIYAEAGRWENVERLRNRIMGQSLSKQPGCSQIELS